MIVGIKGELAALLPRTPVTNLKAPGSGALGPAGASGAPTARVKACGVGGGVMADDDENR